MRIARGSLPRPRRSPHSADLEAALAAQLLQPAAYRRRVPGSWVARKTLLVLGEGGGLILEHVEIDVARALAGERRQPVVRERLGDRQQRLERSVGVARGLAVGAQCDCRLRPQGAVPEGMEEGIVEPGGDPGVAAPALPGDAAEDRKRDLRIGILDQ